VGPTVGCLLSPRSRHAGQSGHAARHLASPCAGRGHKARRADRELLASTPFGTTRLASVRRSPAAAAAPSPLQVPSAAALRPRSPRPTTSLTVRRHSRRYPRPHPRRWARCRRLSDSRLQYSRPPGLASSPESGSLTKPLPPRRRDRSPQPLAASRPSRLVRLPPRQPRHAGELTSAKAGADRLHRLLVGSPATSSVAPSRLWVDDAYRCCCMSPAATSAWPPPRSSASCIPSLCLGSRGRAPKSTSHALPDAELLCRVVRSHGPRPHRPDQRVRENTFFCCSHSPPLFVGLGHCGATASTKRLRLLFLLFVLC
jgi:hypothetical protein